MRSVGTALDSLTMRSRFATTISIPENIETVLLGGVTSLIKVLDLEGFIRR